MNKKILLIAGHGGTDSGAVGNNRKEAIEVRSIAYSLYEKLKNEIEIEYYNPSVKHNSTKDYAKYKGYNVIEIHLNSAGSIATGTEVLIKKGYKPDSLDTALLHTLGKYFRNRGFKYRDDLYSMNTFGSLGITYRLIEICFINNINDLNVLDKNYNSIINDLSSTIKPYGIKKVTTNTTVNTPVTTNYYPKVNQNNKSIVDALRSIGVDCSFTNRLKIASKNGFVNYTGSAEQNIRMLNLLKNGKLKK